MEERSYEHFGLLNQLRAVPWQQLQRCRVMMRFLVTSFAEAGFTCPGGNSYAPNDVPLKFDCRL